MRAARITALAGWMILFAALDSQAQDFRVETDVFIGKSTEPAAQYLTLFYAGRVYDFALEGPPEITVFDVTRGRFLLLDTERQVKTELTTRDVDAFHERLRDRALERNDALFDTNFQYTFDANGNWHVLTSGSIEYRAQGAKGKYESAAQQYRIFADGYARLNAMRPGNPPPYARLELNRILAEHQLVPETVERAVTAGRITPRKLVARTVHHVNWRLSAPDHKRIERVGDQLASFRAVSYPEFLKLDITKTQ